LTQLALLDQIIVAPDRMRKEFADEAIQELMQSIASKGLMHAPAVRAQEGTDALELVAGERRLKAMTRLHASGTPFFYNGDPVPAGHIPYTIVTGLSPYLVAEAELEENIIRQDLSWQEQADARMKLLKLRKLMAEERGEKYDGMDFVRDLQAAGAPQASVSQVFREIKVAEHLGADKVRAAGSLKEAEKLVTKEREAFLLNALGDTLKKAPPPKHTFYEGDCLEVVATLPGDTFDCVLTDPPYGIDIHDSGSMVEHSHHYDDSPEILDNILDRLPFHLRRITRPMAHVYWFCDLRWFPKIAYALEEAGFVVWKYPIIWWKRGKAMAPDYVRWPKREYECILFASKGDKPLHKVAGDVISTPYGSDLQQAEKPKELYVELLSRSCLPGTQVIDPFCGSGVIFPAADELKLAATGIEINSDRAPLARMKAHGI
jgi:adenine-specific DNA-methyltransferase